MADFVLEISSFEDIVPGARHYRGRVKGESPRSCHGSMSYNDPEHRGAWSCSEGHELPERAEWDVEAAWTEERYERYAARQFEGDGPGQFSGEAEVIEAAVRRFTGQDPARWWEDAPVTGQPGDRLFCGFVPLDPADVDGCWGALIAEVPAAPPCPEPARAWRPCENGTRVSTCCHVPRCGPMRPGQRPGDPPFGRWQDTPPAPDALVCADQGCRACRPAVKGTGASHQHDPRVRCTACGVPLLVCYPQGEYPPRPGWFHSGMADHAPEVPVGADGHVITDPAT